MTESDDLKETDNTVMVDAAIEQCLRNYFEIPNPRSLWALSTPIRCLSYKFHAIKIIF